MIEAIPSQLIANSASLPGALFLEAIQVAIIATDLTGKIIYWNPFAERLYGWPAMKVLGRNIMEITVSSVTREQAQQHMQKVLEGGNWAGEFQVHCKDGSYLEAFVTLSPIRDHTGNSVGIIGVSQDASGLKEAEGALRRSEEQFRAFANSLPELCFVADPDGAVFWYSDRWFEYTGETAEQLQGWGWQRVHDPQILPSVLERWNFSLQSGEAFEMEFPLRGADGLFRWFLTRVRPVFDDAGRIVRWYGTTTNVDDQRTLLRQLSEAREHLEKSVEDRTAQLKFANESLRELSARLLRLRDEEQRRLARELHDSVGQLVAAISMNVDVISAEADKLTAG